MTHISRGDIHALIDGALIGDREPEARKIEEHLEGCAECTRLLNQEQKNISGVFDVVSSALEIPPRILDSFPSVQELSARAEAEQPSVVPITAQVEAQGKRKARTVHPLFWSFRLQLQWAATVVVSLGGGWWIGAQLGVPAPSMVSEGVQSLPALEDTATQLMAAATVPQDLLLRGDLSIEALPDAMLGIPGLDVIEIRLLSALRGGETGILVIQEFDGRTVEVYHVVAPEFSQDGDLLEQARDYYSFALQAGWGLEVIRGPRCGGEEDLQREITVLRGPFTEAEMIDLGERMALPGC